MKPLFLIQVLALVSSVFGQSEPDPLPRRGYFGVGLEKGDVEPRVFSVAPNSTAAEAGVLVGDSIGSVDDRTMDTPEAVVTAIGRHRSGESVSIGVQRNGERRIIEALLKPLPSEQMVNAK